MSDLSFHTALGGNNSGTNNDNNNSGLSAENVANVQAYVDPTNAQIMYMQHIQNEYDRLSALIRNMNKEMDRLYAEAIQLRNIPNQNKTPEHAARYRSVAARHNALLDALPGIEAQQDAVRAQFMSLQMLGGRRTWVLSTGSPRTRRRLKNRKHKKNAKTTAHKYRRRS